MGIKVPRVTFSCDYGDDSSFGELGLISVGYGLHQAWIYATMFAAPHIFGISSFITGWLNCYTTLPYLISILAFGMCLLIAAAIDRSTAAHLKSSHATIIGCVLEAVGTAMLFLPHFFGTGLTGFEILSGVITGIGSSIVTLQWGLCFAYRDSSSIVLNSATGIAIGLGVYALVLKNLPFPIGGISVALVPLIELVLLLKIMARMRQAGDHNFNPLPLNRAKFAFAFGVPVLVFGFALGMLRQTSIQTVLPANTANDQIILMLAACLATVLIPISIYALGDKTKMGRLFRPLVPFIVVTLMFLPFSSSSEQNASLASTFLLTGYMCFEALMWIYFGEISQRYRLSPVFVYGIGRGFLALAAIAGSLLPMIPPDVASNMPFGENTIIVLILLVIVFAYSFLPSPQTIESLAIPCPLIRAANNPPSSNGSRDFAPADENEDAQMAASDLDEQSSEQADEQIGKEDSLPATNDIASQYVDKPVALRGQFRRKCETVANVYLLSARETEVLFYLAKGHNSAYIQEKLFIAEGTAKTHMRHIYRKLDVHTQQELMRLVENIDDLQC